MPYISPLQAPGSPNSSNRQSVKPAPLQSTSGGSNTAPNLSELPYRYQRTELFDPEEFIKDDPAFDTRHAAAILGVAADRLMKWRQRGQGPDYLAYEDAASAMNCRRSLPTRHPGVFVLPVNLVREGGRSRDHQRFGAFRSRDERCGADPQTIKGADRPLPFPDVLR